MNNITIKDWVQFLKNNQIVSMNSDPVTGKLIYRKKVTSADLISFLEGNYSIEFSTPDEIVRNIIPSIKNTDGADGEFDGFVDAPEDEITESDVKNVFLYIKKEEENLARNEVLTGQAAEISRIKEVIYTGMSGPRRSIFVNLIDSLLSGRDVVHVANIEKLFPLVATSSPKPKFFGMMSSKKAGVSSESLQNRWINADCPLEKGPLFSFLNIFGFENDALNLLLLQIENLGNLENSYGYDSLLNIARYIVKSFNADQITEIIEYTKHAPPAPEVEDSDEYEDSSLD